MEGAQEVRNSRRYFESLRVSILVVMEGAQEVGRDGLSQGIEKVSILVVMEGAQEASSAFPLAWIASCFNPCCNGRCSGSDADGEQRTRHF